MHLKVALFGPLRQYAPGQSEEFDIELPAETTVMGLLDKLGVEERVYLVVLVNNFRVDEDHPLHDGDDVKILTPLGGG